KKREPPPTPAWTSVMDLPYSPESKTKISLNPGMPVAYLSAQPLFFRRCPKAGDRPSLGVSASKCKKLVFMKVRKSKDSVDPHPIPNSLPAFNPSGKTAMY